MTWQENFLSNLLTVSILVGLVLIVYLKATNKTLIDLIMDIKEVMSGGSETAIDTVQGGFSSIR